MKKLFLTLVTMIVGLSAYCQMGPWHPIGPVLPPAANSGYAAGAEIVNGTCHVLCLDDPDHTCMKKETAMGRNPAVDVLGSKGEILLKVSYSKGQYLSLIHISEPTRPS